MIMPDSWVEVRLGDVCSEDRRSIDGKAEESKKIPYLGLDNIESGTGRITLPENDLAVGSGKSNCFLFDKRHILYGKLRPYLNKVALPDFEGRCTTEAIPILPLGNMHKELLAYIMKSSTFVKWAMSTNTGSRMPRANMSKLLEIKIPLPPLAEQKRIVAKIEACFAHADKIAADIDKARVSLKKFREAVLAKAFAGELVAREPDTEWQEARLGDVFEVVGGSTPRTSNPLNFTQNGIKWIAPSDLSNFKGMFISGGKKDITQQGYDSCSTRMLPKHSVVYTTRAPIGHIAITSNELCTNQGFKSIVTKDVHTAKYVYFCLKNMTPYIQSRGSGTTFKEVSSSVMKSIKIPLPSPAEQKRIVAKIEACFAHADEIAADIDKATVLLKKFREAVLAKAFQGELVPQDASEGTGHALWQKISQEHRDGARVSC